MPFVPELGAATWIQTGAWTLGCGIPEEKEAIDPSYFVPFSPNRDQPRTSFIHQLAVSTPPSLRDAWEGTSGFFFFLPGRQDGKGEGFGLRPVRPTWLLFFAGRRATGKRGGRPACSCVLGRNTGGKRRIALSKVKKTLGPPAKSKPA